MQWLWSADELEISGAVSETFMGKKRVKRENIHAFIFGYALVKQSLGGQN